MSAVLAIEEPRRYALPRLVVSPALRLSNLAFAAVVGLVLVAGLLASLFVNVLTTQGAFQEAALRRQVDGIVAEQQAAQETLQMLASPGNLEARARAMGMVPAATPVFLRLTDGRVLGSPEAAIPETAPKAVLQLMPSTRALGPELQMAPAAVKARVIAPTSDAAVELPAGQQ